LYLADPSRHQRLVLLQRAGVLAESAFVLTAAAKLLSPLERRAFVFVRGRLIAGRDRALALPLSFARIGSKFEVFKTWHD